VRDALSTQEIDRLGESLFSSIVPIIWVICPGKLVAEVSLDISPPDCEKRLKYPVFI